MSKYMTGVMLDESRGAVTRPDAIKRMIPMLEKMGYNTLMLYTEETYEVPGEPYFGYLRGRYSTEELRDIDACAKAHGIELIPCIQTLAHLDGIMRWSAYAPVNDCFNILLVGEEKTYDLIDRMFTAIEEAFTSRTVHIGMDEAHFLGLGRYLDRNGYENRTDILLKHLTRVVEIAKKHGFSPMMWSDMFFRLANGGKYAPVDFPKEVADLVPEGLGLVYWDYYRTDVNFYVDMMKSHMQFEKNTVYFAGGAWTWRGFTPCTRAALETTKAALEACRISKIPNMFTTLWGDDGTECSFFAVLPVLHYTAQMRDREVPEEEIKKTFAEITGEDYDAMCALGLPNEFEEKVNTHPVAKLYLYSDPFLGMFDNSVPEGLPAYYREIATRLRAYGKKSENYGYLFEEQAALSDVLAKKCDLGVRTRALYKKGDRAGLLDLANGDYRDLVSLIEKFHDLFRRRWLFENKGYGLEWHDARLGGLVARIRSCRERLLAYLGGEVATIEELDEPLLDYYPGDGTRIAEEQPYPRIAFPYGKAGHTAM